MYFRDFDDYEVKEITWIPTFEVFGYSSDEDKQKLKELLKFILDYIENGKDIPYYKMVQEFERKITEYFKGFKKVYKPVATEMLHAQLDNPKDVSIRQLNTAISCL